MLNYFKKRKGHPRSQITSVYPFQQSNAKIKGCSSSENESTHNDFATKRKSLESTSSFCDDILSQCEAEEDTADTIGSCTGSLSGYSLVSDDDIFRYKSRLAISLPSIVSDPSCLSFFVQYLDMRKALGLLKFYLDTENFKKAALTHLEKKFNRESGPFGHPSDLSAYNIVEGETDDTDSVPQLKNYYDISMRQPLTDDEKSKIYAETNKQIHKCNENKHSNENSNDNSNGNLTTVEISCNSDNPILNLTDTADCKGHRMSGEEIVDPASVKDAISIYQKYLIANACNFVALPVEIISQISLLLCQQNETLQESYRTNNNKGSIPTIPATCFDEAQQYVMDKLERMYLNDFLQSPFYIKYCIELVENGQPELSIYDILYSETTLFFFMEFLEQHGERECLDFWTSAINFRKSYETLAEELACNSSSGKDKSQNRTLVQSEASTDAMIIYEKFFSLQSEDRFWFSDRLRSQVEERICSDGRIAHCFDLPLQLIAKYLEYKYFKDFLNSQIFQNYLNELKLKLRENYDKTTSTELTRTTSVKTSRVFRKSLHRKTLSDCSEENKSEGSKHNTLLAMDGNKLPQTRIKSLQQTTGSDLHIDSRQLTNPNLLWRRSYSSVGNGGLKFGHVNELGRYERDFQAVDAAGNDLASGGKHNWSLNFNGNKIKNAMRKLVNMPEDKVQEEIAWQVAEMIVKDVTSITLKNDKVNTTLIMDKTNNKTTTGAV